MPPQSTLVQDDRVGIRERCGSLQLTFYGRIERLGRINYGTASSVDHVELNEKVVGCELLQVQKTDGEAQQ